MPRKDRKNWEVAYNYFVEKGLIPKDHAKNEYVLHHLDDTLKEKDPVRYLEWRIEDLIPMLKSEHTSMHLKGIKKSPEQRKNLSESIKGHKVSEETRKKISETQKGRKYPKTSAGLKEYYKNHHPWNYKGKQK